MKHMTIKHEQLEAFLEELEQLLDKHCTPDWFYRFDIEDGVGINLSIPEFRKETTDEGVNNFGWNKSFEMGYHYVYTCDGYMDIKGVSNA